MFIFDRNMHLGEISGGRINGGASPPFVRVKAEDSSLKNIRL
uniref:Uncharacterized protein n=1 Tax=Aeromonas caviae TaxID=648 RepID=A0A6M4NRQ2_AERCA|nr:Hypothetical protein [Aeromonas caviae]